MMKTRSKRRQDEERPHCQAAAVGDDADDEDRRAILERRKTFIAMALSGLSTIGAACGDEVSPFRPCLEPPAKLVPIEPVPPPVTPPPPDMSQVTITDMGTDMDTVTDTDTDMDTGMTPTPAMGPGPRVCLRRLPPPHPHPCLSIAPHPCLEYAVPPDPSGGKPGGAHDDVEDDEA
jgi:hypothetical protein